MIWKQSAFLKTRQQLLGQRDRLTHFWIPVVNPGVASSSGRCWEGGGGRGGARAGADTRGLRLQRGGEGDELLARRLAVDAALA